MTIFVIMSFYDVEYELVYTLIFSTWGNNYVRIMINNRNT